MAVYRVERTRDYTVMCNCHLKDTSLSLKAKGLLSMMLSLPDEWNYNTRGLAAICKEGVDAISTAIRELEKAGYIVRRQLRGSNGRITDTEYIIYERPQDQGPTAPEPPEPDPPEPEAPGLTSPYPENPYVVEPDMALPRSETTAGLNINTSSKKKENTKRCSYPSVSPSTGERMDGQTDVTDKRAEIMEQIEYDRIVSPANREQIDEFVEIMLEVALTRSPTIRIGREAEYPAALVQQRFEKLTATHIGKILDGIQENTSRVRNVRNYLLAALFNAPSSTDNHYTMLVNHDLHHSG